MRQNGLAETMKLIERHRTEGTPSVMQNSMPHFVGIAQESTTNWMVIIELKCSN